MWKSHHVQIISLGKALILPLRFKSKSPGHSRSNVAGREVSYKWRCWWISSKPCGWLPEGITISVGQPQKTTVTPFFHGSPPANYKNDVEKKVSRSEHYLLSWCILHIYMPIIVKLLVVYIYIYILILYTHTNIALCLKMRVYTHFTYGFCGDITHHIISLQVITLYSSIIAQWELYIPLYKFHIPFFPLYFHGLHTLDIPWWVIEQCSKAYVVPLGPLGRWQSHPPPRYLEPGPSLVEWIVSSLEYMYFYHMYV